MTVRVCPERDAVCPYGMGCPFTETKYTCRPGWNGGDPSPTPAQQSQIDTAYQRLKATRDSLRQSGTPEAAIREAIRRLADD